MSSNRLFIYDEETNSAVCIAKGYTNGWVSHGDMEYINEFYDDTMEFTGNLSASNPTKLSLKTEDNLPNDCHVIYQGA